MVDQPPYRKPHEDADGRRGAPRHTLIRGEAPLLGAYAVSVGLSSAITLAVDRRALELTPGSGARVEFEAAPLPAVDLRGLRLDLTSFAFELDADNLGPFTSAAGSIRGSAREIVSVSASSSRIAAVIAKMSEVSPRRTVASQPMR